MTEICKCPTCGHIMQSADIEIDALLDGMPMPATRQAILDELVQSYPGWALTDAIARDIYGEATPSTLNRLRALMYHLRKDIEPFGWVIEGKLGRGSPGYRLKTKTQRAA